MHAIVTQMSSQAILLYRYLARLPHYITQQFYKSHYNLFTRIQAMCFHNVYSNGGLENTYRACYEGFMAFFMTTSI